MILINEWLPNPVGADAKGEWIELYNQGSAGASLDGWMLRVKGGGHYALKGVIEPGAYLVIPRATSKLVFKNTDERVDLYDNRGALRDSSRFFGTAPEGKSFSRTAGGSFIFASPTPGAKNGETAGVAMIERAHPAGVPLHDPFSVHQLLFLDAAVALIFTGVMFFIAKQNENLSKLLFGRN